MQLLFIFCTIFILTTETNGLIKLTPNLTSKVHEVFVPLSYLNLFLTLELLYDKTNDKFKVKKLKHVQDKMSEGEAAFAKTLCDLAQ